EKLSEDPFELYDLIKNATTKRREKDSPDPVFPPDKNDSVSKEVRDTATSKDGRWNEVLEKECERNCDGIRYEELPDVGSTLDMVLESQSEIICSNFVALEGTWLSSITKRGEVILMGDFNEVRWEHERFGSVFNHVQANKFNEFISEVELVDVPLGGYMFTWSDSAASKMSKIDRKIILSFPKMWTYGITYNVPIKYKYNMIK
ncbi:RNA-directed DNA polymerase, eukaryota, partial [Tanacetum coccineum]